MRLIAIFMTLALTGCGVAAIQQARDNYQHALTNYRGCVQAGGPDACKTEKAILDADADAYRAMRGSGAVIVSD